ncbi:hypothetical protein [Acidicapsa ligni]|uniref:hypothetical protein n=1 Tax=Acidicapsa ligni TaxID=542300 RepID=UPI0021E015CE|nr:hypothetical protein [Acidicapsa ligni]
MYSKSHGILEPMKHKWKLIALLGFLFSASVQGQSGSVGNSNASLNSAIAPVADTAQLIGISAELNELHHAPQDGLPGSPEQWRILWLHQRIVERTTTVQLQIDATLAEIDNEIARSTEVRGFLADRRDSRVTRANLWSALVGGGLGGTSAGLQLSTKQTAAAAGTGITGGALAAGLALYGIHAQKGESRVLETDSNMLAQFFDRPVLSTSNYPPIVWQFLNEVAPSDPDHITRKERLVRTWLELKRLDPPPSTPAGQVKIDHVTSMPAQHQVLSIDDLEDRMAMLQDVRAKLSYLKRDLAALLESLSGTS